MQQSIFLAFKYLSFHKTRSTVLIFSIGLIMYLPNGLKRLIDESEIQMITRAKSTPLIIGANGSSTDLVINSLYFQQEKIASITMGTIDKVNAANFGRAIPVICMFSTRGFPIVGTDPDYFSFRKLRLLSGRWMSFLGECVIGSAVADKLNVGVGDSLVSSPENLFDLAGVYPLKLTITGVLDASDSPDDQAVFVDIKTNWVIMGLGHGHQDMEEVFDPSIVLERDSNEVRAGAKLYMYNTITEENLDSFHFHGDMNDYPISALIFVPSDHKSETIFMGRFETGEYAEQVVVPEEVVNNLLQHIFRIRQVFDTVFILVGVAMLLIFSLIVALTVRLRKNEIYTLFTIGSSRGKVVEIISFELIILAAGSIVFAGILYSITGFFVDDFIRYFVI